MEGLLLCVFYERKENVLQKKKNNAFALKVIPLGGLGEIGKNMTVFEYGNEIIVVDCGMSFPEENMPGIDLVIPDTTYLRNNREKIRGIIITHGHEDHIGAVPYVLKEFNVPLYGTRLALGLLQNKFQEHNIQNPKLQTVKPGDEIRIGAFTIEFIKTNHSIADSVALAIKTPVGTVVHTGDFKVDFTPIDGQPIDLARFGRLGDEGVLLLMADSTNVERPGYTMSEKTVGATFEEFFGQAKGRIIVATFASNIHRIQQVVDAAAKYNRKICISGRSMVNVVSTAQELGYLRFKNEQLIDIDEIGEYPDKKIVVITTGSQGEPMSALSRMAHDEHRQFGIKAGDTVIISASAIPGNEKTVSNVINLLFEKGANVIYEALADIHVSGHACQEELKLIHALVRPRFFMPVHGEYRHLKQHALLAESMGMKPRNIIVPEVGSVIQLTPDSIKVVGKVTAGQVLVDGLGIGDVGNVVLRDRKHLSQDGLMVVVVTIQKDNSQMVGDADIISRGFIYVREAEDLMDEARALIKEVVHTCHHQKVSDWTTLKARIREQLQKFLYKKTKRRPMILPIIVEV